MRVTERGGRCKRDANYQLVPEPPKAIRVARFVSPAGIGVLLDAVRHKRA
jgi:hypothetical protein